MTEQERRAEYTKRTGIIATSDQAGYFAFCQGIDFEREECAKVCEAGINNADDWDSSYWDQACANRAHAIRERSNGPLNRRGD